MIEDFLAAGMEWALTAPRKSPQRWILLAGIVFLTVVLVLVAGVLSS